MYGVDPKTIQDPQLREAYELSAKIQKRMIKRVLIIGGIALVVGVVFFVFVLPRLFT